MYGHSFSNLGSRISLLGFSSKASTSVVAITEIGFSHWRKFARFCVPCVNEGLHITKETIVRAKANTILKIQSCFASAERRK